jgi:hypothetical protein
MEEAAGRVVRAMRAIGEGFLRAVEPRGTLIGMMRRRGGVAQDSSPANVVEAHVHYMQLRKLLVLFFFSNTQEHCVKI